MNTASTAPPHFIELAECLLASTDAGKTCVQLAEEHRIPATKVRHLVRVAKRLNAEVKDLCRVNDQLSFGHARALASLNGSEQNSAAGDCLAKGWSVRQLESHRRGESSGVDSNYLERLAERVSESIGHPMSIRLDPQNPANGVIEIRYFGADDFDAICCRMGVDLSEF